MIEADHNHSRGVPKEPRPRRKGVAARPDQIAYSVDQACAISGRSRAGLYRLMKSGEIKFVTIGARRSIIGDSLRRLLTGEG